MTTATERYKLLVNIIAQKGIDGDIISELSRVESMINQIEQGKMMPPPIPPEISPTQNTPMPTESNISPETTNTSPI